MKTTVLHDDWLMARLADAEFAAEYLNAANEDDDPKTYLTALRKVVEARGGMASVADKAELSRETLLSKGSGRGIDPSPVAGDGRSAVGCGQGTAGEAQGGEVSVSTALAGDGGE